MPFPQPDPSALATAAATPAALPATPAFSAGSVVGRSFSVWFGNFVPFSIVTLVVYLPIFVLAAVAPPEPEPGWNLADTLLSALANLVVTGALTHGVLESLRGGRAGLGALLSTGFRKMGWVFVVSLRVGLWVLLGAILLVVPAVVFYCGLYVAIPAVVVEDNGSDALARSRELTKDHRWAIFAVVAVVFVVTSVVVGLGGSLVVLPGLPHPIPAILGTAVIALTSALGACASAVAYHDLRVAKEGVGTADLVKVFE